MLHCLLLAPAGHHHQPTAGGSGSRESSLAQPGTTLARPSGYPAILFLAVDNIFDLITHILRRRFRTPRPRQRTAAPPAAGWAALAWTCWNQQNVRQATSAWRPSLEASEAGTTTAATSRLTWPGIRYVRTSYAPLSSFHQILP